MKAEWSKTVQDLLIGTTRGGGSPTDLLSDCAALGVAAFGATLPQEVQADPLPLAPPETAELPRPAARAVLQAIMSLDDEVLLTEWCALAKAGNVVAEHRMLPALLALGTARPGLRAAVVEVLGTRGRWLANTRPGWSWASGTAPLTDEVPLEEVLDLPSAQRVRALRRKRKADPAGTGAFIATEFEVSRRSSDRQALISALETGLSPSDEELLEEALDDRASAVHDEALRLLRKLPTSALATRAADRLGRGLWLTDDGFDVQTDELWTAQPDLAEQRDLMRDGSEKGVAGRIRAAAASVPPSYWTARLETNDAKAANVLRRGPWAGALLRGIADQLAAAGDPRPWAVAPPKPSPAWNSSKCWRRCPLAWPSKRLSRFPSTGTTTFSTTPAHSSLPRGRPRPPALSCTATPPCPTRAGVRAARRPSCWPAVTRICSARTGRV
ncbi:hypothetical protein FXN61_02330 [Lentzea sp. PSKA42]|uniref:HEAT repeat-containing protein n=1 Tax=Lentzea indica TaxID=2604800 RepID=A0ABX1F9Y6_9PSEU|nr:DUF5691 domain-containing protein [Lentzea indica]NKE55718.1 hypothetical protein [Lentzea indica]